MIGMIGLRQCVAKRHKGGAAPSPRSPQPPNNWCTHLQPNNCCYCGAFVGFQHQNGWFKDVQSFFFSVVLFSWFMHILSHVWIDLDDIMDGLFRPGLTHPPILPHPGGPRWLHCGALGRHGRWSPDHVRDAVAVVNRLLLPGMFWIFWM